MSSSDDSGTVHRGAGDSGELVEALLDPATYPHRPARVELRETHSSWVFLAGDLAYKAKKPVRFPFLDYGTVERRREMCKEEVRLNRRLAPSYYLGVEAVVRTTPTGFAFAAEDDPEAVEYVVKMRRVPEERTLEHRARRRTLMDSEVDAVAERLAAFHASAPTISADSLDADALLRPIEENVETLREVGPPTVPADRLLALDRYTRAFITARESQMAARLGGGRVRECHGDLRAEHVILGEEIEVYDCIEFNRDLQAIDVAADLAFLVMDLWRLGAGEASGRLVNTYRAAGGDPGDDALLHFYAAYRAWVRAKVGCLRLPELAAGDEDRPPVQSDVGEITALGHRLAWRSRTPVVLVICGVARSGKSVLAGRLAEISGLPRLRSDELRKRLAGLSPAERGAAEIYTQEFSRRTYTELGREARAALERSRGAIVDATFHRRAERDAFAAGLGDGGASVLFAQCTAPARVLLERAEAPDAPDPSDATPDVVRRQLQEFEPLEEVPDDRRAEIPTDREVADEAVEVETLADRCLVIER